MKRRPLRRSVIPNGAWIDALSSQQHSMILNTHWTGYHGKAGPWNSYRRTLSDHLVYVVTGGACDGWVDGEAFRAEAGMAVWISAGVPHEIRYERLDHYVLRFRLTDGRREIVPEHRVLIQSHALELCPLLDQIRNEMLGPSSWMAQRMRALLVLFFTSFFRLQTAGECNVRTLRPSQRNQIIEYVHANGDAGITPASLARHMGLSRDYFAVLFRNTFGQVPRCWLMRERIRLASMKMMVSDLSVKQVASAFGYSNVSLFSRQFKHVLGLGPRAFRKRRDGLR